MDLNKIRSLIQYNHKRAELKIMAAIEEGFKDLEEELRREHLEHVTSLLKNSDI